MIHLVFILLSIYLNLIFSYHAQSATHVGKIVSITGDVLIRNESNQNPNFHKIKVSESLSSGDILNTNSNGSAKLLMADQTIIDLGPSTLFKIDEFTLRNISDRAVSLTVDYGKVRALVNRHVGESGRFKVRTRTAVMGVRGTEFVIGATLTDIPSSSTKMVRAQTQLTVIQGKVEVQDTSRTSEHPTLVTEGHQLVSSATLYKDHSIQRSLASESPTLVILNAHQLKSALQDAKVSDPTFKQAILIDSSHTDSSSAGHPTLAAIGSAVMDSLPASTPKNYGNIVTPGTSINPIPIIPRNYGAPVQLKVVFQK